MIPAQLKQAGHALLDGIQTAAGKWFDVKTYIERSVAFSDDVLHVLAGVFIQLIAAALLRSSVGRWRPWLIVLALELLNEWSDFHVDHWPDLGMQLGESTKDVVLTMALPTVLLIVSRRWPRLLVRPPRP